MNQIQKYLKYRQSLIDQYLKGDMTKKEYLAKNLEAVLSPGIRPFRNIDTVEKGLFNYQYYNAMAKQARAEGLVYSDYEIQKEYQESSDYYYSKKDKATLAILKLIDFKEVTAYFIVVRSRYLKGKLFEIVLHEQDVILHSANELILNRLRDEMVFEETTKVSLIDSYVNQKY